MGMGARTAITTIPKMGISMMTVKATKTQLLSSLFSPAFPIGAFAFSQGIETAINKGFVDSPESLKGWIKTCVCYGSGWNDAILLARAWRGDDVNALALALAAGRERWQETTELGDAFTRMVTALHPVQLEQGLAYPVAAGLALKQLECGLELSLEFYLQAFVANLISVGVRCVPIGQTDGQAILVTLMPSIVDVAQRASAADLAAIGGCSFMADLCSLAHESQETRIYRT